MVTLVRRDRCWGKGSIKLPIHTLLEESVSRFCITTKMRAAGRRSVEDALSLTSHLPFPLRDQSSFWEDPDTSFHQLLRLIEQPSEFEILNFRDQPSNKGFDFKRFFKSVEKNSQAPDTFLTQLSDRLLEQLFVLLGQ